MEAGFTDLKKPPVPVKPLSSAESSPVSMPSTQSPASSSLDSPRTRQRSYVLSALKKFDPSKEKAVETLIVTHVEEALKTPIDTPLEGVETVIVTHVEEALKTSTDTPVEKAKETITVTHVEEALRTPIDTPVEETVEIQVYTRVQEALKTQADTPVEEAVEPGIVTQLEKAMKTHIVTNVEDSVEKPVYTHVQDALKTSVDSYEEEAMKTSADMASTYHGPYSEALLERAVETLDKNPAETSELTVEPSVAAPAEHHRLNSQAGVNMNGKTICSFYKLPIDGNVKIIVNIPAISCHPDCFKYDGCSRFMGNLLSSMYHYAGTILCRRCFDKTFFLEI
ncbi:zinc finger protein 185 [Xyrauchen texanus]|uniref:zinc finger protein 185 n=1 Tax=Xyrauchen texanus TaxID=154827 RepID=UPI0022428CB7|nr:zinc finger protein 185 [Xyrauchen texanus]